LKLSKSAKARIKRMSMTEKKSMLKAASMLADAEAISNARFNAIRRVLES